MPNRRVRVQWGHAPVPCPFLLSQLSLRSAVRLSPLPSALLPSILSVLSLRPGVWVPTLPEAAPLQKGPEASHSAGSCGLCQGQAPLLRLDSKWGSLCLGPFLTKLQ